jgi:hypothetical protein
LEERDICALLPDNDLLVPEVLVILVFRLELLAEGYLLITDRDCVRACDELVARVLLTIPERLVTLEFPVGFTRFFPTDDRMDFPEE